jgi:hypothetical protein
MNSYMVSRSVPNSQDRPFIRANDGGSGLVNSFIPGRLLHMAGAVVLLLTLCGYWMTQGNWWVFALILLAPDLSMIGYLGGARTDAVVYNVFHTYLLPVVFFVAGTLLANLWMTHIVGRSWCDVASINRISCRKFRKRESV